MTGEVCAVRVLDRLLEGARRGESDALLRLLTASGETQAQLFAAARAVRDVRFGKTAVVRGVIEIASACVKSCAYCPMRVEAGGKRFFRREDDILASVAAVREAGLGVVFFQGGEIAATTPLMTRLIPEARALFGGEVEIMLGLGDKTEQELAALRDAGADSYILKHETSDPALHRRMVGAPIERRLAVLHDLVAMGYRTGVGTIVGLPGQRAASLVDDIRFARMVGAKMTSASPFVPAPATPLADAPAGDVDLTLNVIALMRLANPDALIPSVSALEKRATGGQARALDAGANVITVNFTPLEDRARYPIYGKDRFVVGLEHGLGAIEQAGLRPRFGAEAFAFWGAGVPPTEERRVAAPAW